MLATLVTKRRDGGVADSRRMRRPRAAGAGVRRGVALAFWFAAPGAVAAQAMAGRVIDATTGQPVPSTAVATHVDTSLVVARTGRDGTFLLALPRGGRFRLQLFPDAGPAYFSDSIDVADTAFVQREFPLVLRRDPVYADFQVDKPVVPNAGTVGPRYPEALKRRKVNGGVLATFVVDTTGRVRAGTFQALEATHTAFVSAVAASVATALYVPAERGGRKVAQLVRQPFGFCMVMGRKAADPSWFPDMCSRSVLPELGRLRRFDEPGSRTHDPPTT